MLQLSVHRLTPVLVPGLNSPRGPSSSLCLEPPINAPGLGVAQMSVSVSWSGRKEQEAFWGLGNGPG